MNPFVRIEICLATFTVHTDLMLVHDQFYWHN